MSICQWRNVHLTTHLFLALKRAACITMWASNYDDLLLSRHFSDYTKCHVCTDSYVQECLTTLSPSVLTERHCGAHLRPMNCHFTPTTAALHFCAHPFCRRAGALGQRTILIGESLAHGLMA